MCSSWGASFSSGSGMSVFASNGGAMDEPAGGEEEDRDGEAAQTGRNSERRAEAVALADRADGDRSDADAGVERRDHAAERPAAAALVGVADDEGHERGPARAHADAEE